MSYYGYILRLSTDDNVPGNATDWNDKRSTLYTHTHIHTVNKRSYISLVSVYVGFMAVGYFDEVAIKNYFENVFKDIMLLF